MRTRSAPDWGLRPFRPRARWSRPNRVCGALQQSPAADSRRDRTSRAAREAGILDLERLEGERVLGDGFIDLPGILPVVEQRRLQAGGTDVRQGLVELLLVPLDGLVSLDDLPDAEPCATDFGLAPQNLVGEVDPGALAHPQGLFDQILRDLGKGATGTPRDALDLGPQAGTEPQRLRRGGHLRPSEHNVTQRAPVQSEHPEDPVAQHRLAALG